jgi:hypothetical protein
MYVQRSLFLPMIDDDDGRVERGSAVVVHHQIGAVVVDLQYPVSIV